MYTSTTSTNCVVMSIDVIPVPFFVNFGHISHRFLVILLLTSNKLLSRNNMVHYKLALDFTSVQGPKGTTIYCKSFAPCNTYSLIFKELYFKQL